MIGKNTGLRNRLFLYVAALFLVFYFLLGAFSYFNASGALKTEAAESISESGDILYGVLSEEFTRAAASAGPDDIRLVPKSGVKHIFLVKNHYKNPETVYYSAVTETVSEKRTRKGDIFFEYRRPLPVPHSQWVFVFEKRSYSFSAVLERIFKDFVFSSVLVLPVLFLLLSLISSRITKPLTEISDQIREISAGRETDFSGFQFWGEIGEVASSVEQLSSELRRRTIDRQYFDDILKSVTDILFIIDPIYRDGTEGSLITDGLIRSVNPAAARLTGFHQNELEGRMIGSILQEEGQSECGIHSRQGLNLMNAVLTAPARFRIRKKDGNFLKVAMQSSFMTDRKAGLRTLIISAQDYTEVSGFEDKLSLSESVFENAVEAVVVTDTNAVIEYVNPAFTAITGYAADEVLYQNTRILKSNHHEKEFYRSMWESLEKDGRWQGEIWNRRKNGEAYPQWMTLSAVKDESGKIQKYVSVFHDMTDLRRSQEQLRYQQNNDALTGLPNAMLFRDRIRQLTLRSGPERFAVLILGLDRFMAVNESMGHVNGDTLLRQVAERLGQIHRKEESLCRWGGDEFAMLIHTDGGLHNLTESCSETLKIFEKPFTLQGFEIFITASAGIAVFPEDGGDAEILIRNADAAMHRAKHEGGNSYQLYESEMNREAMERLILETNMRKAVAADEFVVWYQPKIRAATGELIGMEALVRWDVPGRGIVAPGEFIAAAEETGLITEIGAAVLRKAVSYTKKLNDLLLAEGRKELKVSVNISPKQFGQENLPALIEDVLTETGHPPRLLELEITESSLVSGLDETIARMDWIRGLGAGLSLDDFGTGYSSLSYLKKFPISVLKIDQSFVKDMEKNEEDAGLVYAVIAIGKALGLDTVAEGVEKKEHYEMLRRAGCTELQGYYFSRPLPPEAFTEFCRNYRV